MDTTVYVRLTEIATCLCAEYADGNDAGLPGLCFCGVVSGDEASFDYLGDCSDRCGMGWVRLVSAQPWTGIGVESTEPGNCSSLLGLTVEVGVYRCAHVMGSDGVPPTEEEMLAETQLQIADMMAMRRAIVCCGGSKDFVLGAYTPIGPEGAAVGGTWDVLMMEV